MNANKQTKIILAAAGLLIFAFTSCNSPSGPRLTTVLPSTGIDSDPASGLTAGFPLEGDAILVNASVDTSEGLDGIEWVDGLSGSAMRTDSDGEFIRITDDTLTANIESGSVEAWIFPEGSASDHYYSGVVHKGDKADYSDETWSLQFGDNLKPLFYFLGESGSYAWLQAPAVITLNEWHHLAGTWNYDSITDETTVTLYIDGVAVATETASGMGPLKASDGDLMIGSQISDPWVVDPTHGHYTFTGIIDEVALYDVERSAEDIMSTYQVYYP